MSTFKWIFCTASKSKHIIISLNTSFKRPVTERWPSYVCCVKSKATNFSSPQGLTAVIINWSCVNYFCPVVPKLYLNEIDVWFMFYKKPIIVTGLPATCKYLVLVVNFLGCISIYKSSFPSVCVCGSERFCVHREQKHPSGCLDSRLHILLTGIMW